MIRCFLFCATPTREYLTFTWFKSVGIIVQATVAFSRFSDKGSLSLSLLRTYQRERLERWDKNVCIQASISRTRWKHVTNRISLLSCAIILQEYFQDCRGYRSRNTWESHRCPDTRVAASDRNLLGQLCPIGLIRSTKMRLKYLLVVCRRYWPVCRRFRCRTRSSRRRLVRRLREIDPCWKRSADMFYLQRQTSERSDFFSIVLTASTIAHNNKFLSYCCHYLIYKRECKLDYLRNNHTEAPLTLQRNEQRE